MFKVKLSLAALLVVLVAFSSCSIGKETSEKKVQEYNLGIEGSSPVYVPGHKMKEFQSELRGFGESISVCSGGTGSWINPLIDRAVSYQIANAGFGCKLSLKLYSGNRISCVIPKSLLGNFSEAVLRRSETGAALGDFSQDEKEILFDSGYCS